MNGLQIYLLRLMATGLICAGAIALCGKGKKEIVRFCCACILALVTLMPLAKGELYLPDISYEAEVQSAVDDALQKAQEEQIVQTEAALAEDVESFALQYGLTLKADVTCSEDGKAVKGVILHGDGKDNRAEFLTALAQRFGITTDAIKWER